MVTKQTAVIKRWSHHTTVYDCKIVSRQEDGKYTKADIRTHERKQTAILQHRIRSLIYL